MTDPDEPEFASRSERGLHEQLEIVRRDPPRPGVGLVGAVQRTLRWQAVIALPLAAAAVLAAGLTAGFRALFGSGRRS